LFDSSGLVSTQRVQKAPCHSELIEILQDSQLVSELHLCMLMLCIHSLVTDSV